MEANQNFYIYRENRNTNSLQEKKQRFLDSLTQEEREEFFQDRGFRNPEPLWAPEEESPYGHSGTVWDRTDEEEEQEEPEMTEFERKFREDMARNRMEAMERKFRIREAYAELESLYGIRVTRKTFSWGTLLVWLGIILDLFIVTASTATLRFFVNSEPIFLGIPQSIWMTAAIACVVVGRILFGRYHYTRGRSILFRFGVFFCILALAACARL